MKKIFSLVAIAAVAATMFTSCTKDDKPDGPDVEKKAKLSLTATPTTVAVGAEGTFTVTSDINAPEAIVVSVSSSSAATLTVDPASVTIAKGTKTITGKFKGVADGKATITIAASGVTLTVPSVEITVGEAGPDLEVLLECDEANVFPTGNDPLLASEKSNGFGLWFNANKDAVVYLENTGCDYYGKDLQLTAAEKGTDISTLTMSQNADHTLMGGNFGDGFDSLPAFANIGVAQYIVFCITDGIIDPVWGGADDKELMNPEDFTHDKPQMKGWALVSSTDSGKAVQIHAFKFPATKVGE